MNRDAVHATNRGIAYSARDGIEPTIVFLHGLACYAGEWRPLLEHLEVENGIVLVDLRAHGTSRRSTGEDIANEIVADVVDLLHFRTSLTGW